MPTKQTEVRKAFFSYVFGDHEGYVCIAYGNPSNKNFQQRFYKWPQEQKVMLDEIDAKASKFNVWYCTSLLDDKKRLKENCLPGHIVWADLDKCNPDDVTPTPTCVIESSPSRYQALWRLDRIVAPEVAEEYSKRIAYSHRENGADPSGWDLTQLLRVPLTYNFKYRSTNQLILPPEVVIVSTNDETISVNIFEDIETQELAKDAAYLTSDMPDLDTLADPEQIIYKYRDALRRTAFASLYTLEPNKDENWSSIMWRLLMLCLESEMELEEVFAVALTAACNKYARDNRPPQHLWRELLKADNQAKKFNVITGTTSILSMPSLIEEGEGSECFIDKYKAYASDATDAVEEFHELSAAIMLSAVIANCVKVPTSHVPIFPNLWGLILGDSTLTRKTTAMTMAMSMVREIDDGVDLGSEGSAEGLLVALSNRPRKTSIFYKDEVSGFFESINRKDYLAGIPEMLTQLYDSPPSYTKNLAKGSFTVVEPCFIFFGGGIKDKVYELVTEQYILSGFLPRFLVVSGKADLNRVRRTGPPTRTTDKRRADIIKHLADLREVYDKEVSTKIGNASISQKVKHEAILTDEAWDFFGHIEYMLMEKAHNSAIEMIAMPTFTRLAFSMLKLGVLIGAARQEPTAKHQIHVTREDLVNAARFVQGWGSNTVDLLHNAGKGHSERTIERILLAINGEPGITRSKIMQHYKLRSRDAEEIFRTLDERGLIYQKTVRGGKTLYGIGGNQRPNEQ
jgi:hypothetical protein